MGSRSPTGASPRGGAGIPPSRSASIRLITGSGALVVTLALGALLVQRAQLRSLVGLMVALAALALLAGLGFRRPPAFAGSIVLLGAAYGLTLVDSREALDGISLLVACALFLAAELGYLAAETGSFSGLPLRPLLAALVVAIGSAVPSVLVLAIAPSFDLGGGPVLTAGGVAAALILLTVVAATATRRTG